MRVDRFYVRVININENDNDLERDIPLILSILEQFEGAGFGKDAELHIKGGYSIFLSCDQPQIEPIITALYDRGFRPVL